MRVRNTAVAVSIILLLTSVLFVFPSMIMSIPNVDGASRNIFLDGRIAGWNSTDPSITVINGDSVALSLTSGDGAPHQFYIDINGNGAHDCPQEKCSAVFPPDPPPFTFAVDFAAGTYAYVCSIHPFSMRGSFVVQGFTISSSPPSLRVVKGSSNTSTIFVTSVNSFAGIVDLSTTVSSGGPTPNVNPMSVMLSADSTQTLTLTVDASGTAAGSYNVNVIGTSGSTTATQTVATLVVPPDFGISASPTRLVIPLGSSGSSTITLSSLDSFSGNVNLSRSPLPSGIASTFSSSPVTLPAGGMASSILDVTVSSSAVPGTYELNVTGTSGSLSHNTTIMVVAGPDFSISMNPPVLTLTPSSSGASTITLTSLNGFAGTVDLTGTVSRGGLGFSFSPQSVSLSGGGFAIAGLSVNASANAEGDVYSVIVTGTSGPTIHSIALTISVRDFSILLSEANLVLQQGSSVTVMIYVTSINGFAGDVNLETVSSTDALSHLLNATTLSLTSGPRLATLTVSTASAPAGNYTISITGTSGSRARSVSLHITVQPSQGMVGILPLVAGGVAGVVAFAIAGTYLMRRGKQRRSNTSQSDSRVAF